MFLALQFVYAKGAHMRELLLTANKYYAFMISLFKTKFESKIMRKVAVLAAQELLNFEIDPKSQQ